MISFSIYDSEERLHIVWEMPRLFPRSTHYYQLQQDGGWSEREREREQRMQMLLCSTYYILPERVRNTWG